MPTIQIDAGNGMTFNDNKLTTNWDPNDETQPTKSEDGLIIPDLVGKDVRKATSLGGKADNVSIYEGLDGNVYINEEVITYIHTMSAFKVTNRLETKDYAVDTTIVKTMEDIVNEINAVMDNDKYLEVNFYASMKENHLFQLIHTPHPVKSSEWPCAMDSNTRYFGDTTLALFAVTHVEHNAGRASYLNVLTLQCLWSTLSEYEKGTEYTHTIEPEPEPEPDPQPDPQPEPTPDPEPEPEP